MRIKWMVAAVPEDQRTAFSAAQEAWAAIALCEGFLGQVGGWDEAGRACILGCWQSAEHVARFMAHAHDAVTSENQQKDTYSRLDVAHGEVLLRMPGRCSSLPAALAQARLLRVADCRVHAERRDHFLGAQLRVWAPGMAQCAGMLGGAFAAAESGRYLVTTAWQSQEAHAAYVAGPFAGLREAAQAQGDLAAIQGHRVVLEPRWTVLPG